MGKFCRLKAKIGPNGSIPNKKRNHEKNSAVQWSPHFSPEREARARRCLKIQGFDESSPERRERDKVRRRTVQYVEPFV